MDITVKTQINIAKYIYPLSGAKERLSVWMQAKGILSAKKGDPIKELNKIRKEWDRKLPVSL